MEEGGRWRWRVEDREWWKGRRVVEGGERVVFIWWNIMGNDGCRRGSGARRGDYRELNIN